MRVLTTLLSFYIVVVAPAVGCASLLFRGGDSAAQDYQTVFLGGDAQGFVASNLDPVLLSGPQWGNGTTHVLPGSTSARLHTEVVGLLKISLGAFKNGVFEVMFIAFGGPDKGLGWRIISWIYARMRSWRASPWVKTATAARKLILRQVRGRKSFVPTNLRPTAAWLGVKGGK